MAKTSKLARNAQRAELVQRYAQKRAALKATISSPKSTPDAVQAAVNALSRIALRDMALNGLIPGVRKASW